MECYCQLLQYKAGRYRIEVDQLCRNRGLGRAAALFAGKPQHSFLQYPAVLDASEQRWAIVCCLSPRFQLGESRKRSSAYEIWRESNGIGLDRVLDPACRSQRSEQVCQQHRVPIIRWNEPTSRLRGRHQVGANLAAAGRWVGSRKAPRGASPPAYTFFNTNLRECGWDLSVIIVD